MTARANVPADHQPRRALLLVNEHSRSGGRAISNVIDVLQRGGLDVETRTFAKKHPIPGTIRERAGEFDCVIIGGGDGTLNEVAPALVETGLPLGILPLGTANDLARTLGIDADPIAAAHIIVDGHSRMFDLGEVNGKLFWNVASIGVTTDLTRRMSKFLKRLSGRMAYGIAAARTLPHMRSFPAELQHDGRTEHLRTVQVSVGNGRFQGGNIVVDEQARADDGLLHVYCLEVRSRWRLLTLLPALRRGRHGQSADVRSFACTELLVRTRRPECVVADGVEIARTPARFRSKPAAARIYVPAGAASDPMPGST
jgi:diacylglycerol kinase (ATP)